MVTRWEGPRSIAAPGWPCRAFWSPRPGRCAARALGVSKRFPYHIKLPHFVIIEPHNKCNLKCPLCPVGNGTMERARQSMTLEQYEQLIGEIKPFVRRAIIAGAGEPTFHKQCFEMIRIAEQSGIRIVLETNGSIDHAEAIVGAGTTEVLFALDGLSSETYEQYRIGGDFDRTIANLERLCRLKRERGSEHPRVNLQFVVMRDNEKDIPALLEFARELGRRPGDPQDPGRERHIPSDPAGAAGEVPPARSAPHALRGEGGRAGPRPPSTLAVVALGNCDPGQRRPDDLLLRLQLEVCRGQRVSRWRLREGLSIEALPRSP